MWDVRCRMQDARSKKAETKTRGQQMRSMQQEEQAGGQKEEKEEKDSNAVV